MDIHNLVFTCAMIFAPAAAENFVRTGLIEVVVRIEHRLDARRTRDPASWAINCGTASRSAGID